MKKLKLEIDTLQVTSFEIAAPLAERGTVRGHATRDYTCEGDVCYKPSDPAVCADTQYEGCRTYWCWITVYDTCIFPCNTRYCGSDPVTDDTV